jgi:hypothetical protein
VQQAIGPLARTQLGLHAVAVFATRIDDFTAHLAFPEKISTTGTLINSFNLRRLAAYVGQSFLHARSSLGSGNVVQVAPPAEIEENVRLFALELPPTLWRACGMKGRSIPAPLYRLDESRHGSF